MDLTIKNPASEWLGDQTMEVDVYDLVYWRGDSPDWGNPGLALVTTDTLALGTGSVTSLTQEVSRHLMYLCLFAICDVTY